jgi:hypothetical protein
MSLIDMRSGPQDHACSGTWEYLGLNAGGHEIYSCDRGHLGIGPHVNAAHECAAGCTDPMPASVRNPHA